MVLEVRRAGCMYPFPPSLEGSESERYMLLTDPDPKSSGVAVYLCATDRAKGVSCNGRSARLCSCLVGLLSQLSLTGETCRPSCHHAVIGPISDTCNPARDVFAAGTHHQPWLKDPRLVTHRSCRSLVAFVSPQGTRVTLLSDGR